MNTTFVNFVRTSYSATYPMIIPYISDGPTQIILINRRNFDLNFNYASNKIEAIRPGIVDVWNAWMLKGATFSNNDIPLCATTAKEVPKKFISFGEAKTIHNKHKDAGTLSYHIHAFIHFYEDDQAFDGKKNSIWLYPKEALEIIEHYDGIICPDFSTFADFPGPLKQWNIYRMCTFGYWISSLGIPVISNLRWGTSETWEYCFDGNPINSMLAIGVVASRIHLLENRPYFENGLFEAVRRLKPKVILVYGSSNYPFFDKLRADGISVISYPSKTNLAFAGGEKNE